MSCRKWEALVALWVGEDLAPAEEPALAAHLAACPACRELADELRTDRAALDKLRNELPPAAACDAVRAGVLSQMTQSPPTRWVLWGSLAAAAAGLCLVVGLSWMQRMRIEPLPPVVLPRVEVAADPVKPPEPETVKRPPARRRPAKPAEPLLVKMYTDDPEVVIYWIVEGGDGD